VASSNCLVSDILSRYDTYQPSGPVLPVSSMVLGGMR
jgi:hypothetical protein